MGNLITVVAIVGPTAAGKSELALRLAKSFGGEIVSADSRQVYRYMDIGTAKPSREGRSSVPHHLIDIVNPDEEYSLVRFLDDATRAIQEVSGRSMLPIVAGGTGQYVWGLLEGWRAPEIPPNPELRQRLEKRMKTDGLASLYNELLRRDPTNASRLDGHNPRRVIRALEVAYSSSADDRVAPVNVPPPYRVKVVGLAMERPALYKRIDDRVEVMIESGWVDEVRALLGRGYASDLPSLSSLGYRELVRHLRNELPLDEALARIKYSTHALARRQYTWFKPTDERIHWFDSSESLEAAEDEVRRWLETCASL